MTRFLSVLALLTLTSAIIPAAPVPVVPPDPTKDREGNPLPKGATARLGSLAFRGTSMYGLWYSADGKNVYAWDREQMIGWDAGTGKRLERGPFPLGQKFKGYHPVYAGDRLISFEETYANDGSNRLLGRTAVVTGPDGKVISRVDCSSRALGNVSPRAPGNFAVSRDGTRAAHMSDDRTVRAFDLTTGKEIFKEKIGTGQLAGVVLAPDGKTLFVQEVSKSVRRFSLPDGKELSPLAVDEGRLSALVVSVDGALAVSQVAVWDKTALNPQSFAVIHDLVTGKAIGKIEPDGRSSCGPMIGSEAILVVSSTVRPPAPRTVTLARWNLKTLKKEWEIQDSGGMVVSPDGKRMALSNLAGVRIFDAATGKRLDTTAAHPHPIDRVEFSADGETVTTRCQAAVMTWTLRGERKSAADPPELWDGRWDGPRRDSPRAWFEIGADGKTVELAGGHFDNRKGAWRMPLGADVPERPLTHDGKRVIGAVFDAKQSRWDVTVYDGPAAKKIVTWTVPAQPGQAHPAMVLSGDGKTLFGFDGDVVGRDPETGKEKVRVKTGPVAISPGTYFPFQVATTADGARIAVVQQNQKGGSSTLRVFEVKTGKELAAHDIGRPYYPALLFNPTGSRVAVWNVEAGVLVCDAGGPAEPRKLDAGHARPTCAAFSPNSANLVVGYQDGTALVWDLTAK